MKVTLHQHPDGEYILGLEPETPADIEVNAKLYAELEEKGLIGNASSNGELPCQIILRPKKSCE